MKSIMKSERSLNCSYYMHTSLLKKAYQCVKFLSNHVDQPFYMFYTDFVNYGHTCASKFSHDSQHADQPKNNHLLYMLFSLLCFHVELFSLLCFHVWLWRLNSFQQLAAKNQKEV